MSRNLETYLAARSDGAPVEIAADMAGFSLTEARLTETAVAKGELEMPRARARAHTREEGRYETEEKLMARDHETTISVNGGPAMPLPVVKEALDMVKDSKPATATGERLRLFIERIERLEEEKKGIGEDISDVFNEAKSDGFDTKTIKRITKLRKMDLTTRQEAQALLSTYMDAIGMTPIEEAIALAVAA